MAVVKVKQIKATLSRSLDYISRGDKTDDGRLVSTSYGPWEGAGQAETAMLDDLEQAPNRMRKNGVLAHHVIQSFDPNDPITPEQAHELGRQFADEITGGHHKYVIATHVDRDHIHNHIIICAASEDDHRKIRIHKTTLGQWRKTSDELCRKERLSVLPEPDEPRHARSLEEIYAAVHGTGTKEKLRTAIDLTAAKAHDFAEFQDLMDLMDVTVTIRGRHLTYTDQTTGLRVRDTKLGETYDEEGIMLRLTRSVVTPISFNHRLIADRTDENVTVWLPGTRRQRKLVIPMDRIVSDGTTWRAWLTDHRQITILDRRGRYADTVWTHGLYHWFGRPADRLETLADTRIIDVTAGRTAAQRRYYGAQGRRLDRLREETRALNAALRWTGQAGRADTAVTALRERLDEERAGLAASIIALADAIERGDADLQIERREDIASRETRVTNLEQDLNAITRTHKRINRDTPDHHAHDHEDREQRERQHRNTRPRR
ncbi:relaxase/mobilization nuclease domain-containing protein [Bifidobacterium callimiconis]|uniref:Mobilization protein n=1 Tax=Bifidobacterium callimiconis TaxID=2306973 RepID=A0A430FEK2_9BIFI|nr:relaxase/mobilization nuclease domain-containing protein [Bifidobacterium callimiconis]RSX51279.1 mobilization protein [Bifidobacterium callimiconis]